MNHLPDPHEGAVERPVPDVSIVVPTKNSVRTLRRCLESLRAQTLPCHVVVVDNHSTDTTREVAALLSDIVFVAGPERSRQRNLGAAATQSPVIGFVDSDMVLSPSVVEQAKSAIDAGAGSVIVPERSVGSGYWARVRAFERAFYVDVDGIEAPRFFSARLLASTGGYDETLDAGEDWDLGRRASRAGRVERITALIEHDEGQLTYLQACGKKGAYAAGVARFADKNPGALWRILLHRPYIRHPWLLLDQPRLGAGLIALKLGEAMAVVVRLLLAAATPDRPRG
ncbi:MAG: glycosyltransferase [Candidatus Dormibacteraeota bacterium]|nr:glycosyltransferase [Candidatus Dormibacteraeota bacterium]